MDVMFKGLGVLAAALRGYVQRQEKFSVWPLCLF